MRLLVTAIALVLIAGCGGAKSANTRADRSAGTSDPAVTGPPATQTASAPNLITVTDQKVVWECPECGMTFDGPGTCSMKCAELVKMDVAYSCPADNQPVESAGKCPRCPMNAKVNKTVAAGMADPSVGMGGGTAN